MAAPIARKQVRVSGIVQGVGFRPFVYNLACRWGLAGWVRNTTDGLVAEVEGSRYAIGQFLIALAGQHPPFAHVERTEVEELPATGETGFRILESAAEPSDFVLVSPDLGTCEDCLRDFTGPANRRFGYPFTNCTNCGPRYTILRDIPYDRAKTTMAQFRMCPPCQAEYDDPGDRRFHAQPNACPACGPRVEWPGEGDAIGAARTLLAAGGIVAVKGLGGFHLACDAEDGAAVLRLRARKHRDGKPFAIMVRDLESAERYCFVSGPERGELTGVRRPIVVLPRRPGTAISSGVAPDSDTLGVVLPYTPLHWLLFENAPYRALVMTSGNLSEEPIVTGNGEARERLSGVADGFLTHDRDIATRADDSVVRFAEGKTRVLRRSRGYAPMPIDLGHPLIEVLACGAELKNTFCLTKGRYALISQHIGDLENYETQEFFEETLSRLKSLFRVTPRVVAHDLHPGYFTTRFALRLDGVDRIAVQHHHAHIAACMAENQLHGPVIGVAFDGTGLGTDGQIWGGEFLIADLGGFVRRAHLRYVPLPGADRAVREPWRMALSYLMDAFGPECPWTAEAIPAKRVEFVRTMIRNRVNTVQTSSCGRLFDAVASLAGLCHEASFEGQAAMRLEAVAGEAEGQYSFELEPGEPLRVDVRPAIRDIVGDLERGEPVHSISARFHNTLAAAIAEVCVRLRQAEGLRRVCLSGGSFQNVRLLARTVASLRSSGFEVFLHSRTPPNDGGISLGQAAIADHVWRGAAALTSSGT